MDSSMHIDELEARVISHVGQIYPSHDVEKLSARLISTMGLDEMFSEPEQYKNHWDEQDVAIITYGDTFLRENETPLNTLYNFFVVLFKRRYKYCSYIAFLSL